MKSYSIRIDERKYFFLYISVIFCQITHKHFMFFKLFFNISNEDIHLLGLLFYKSGSNDLRTAAFYLIYLKPFLFQFIYYFKDLILFC